VPVCTRRQHGATMGAGFKGLHSLTQEALYDEHIALIRVLHAYGGSAELALSPAMAIRMEWV